MSNNNYIKNDDELYPLTNMFDSVNESNYLQFIQLANIQYNFLFHHKNSSGYDFVNWRVNFANLHEYVIKNNKSEMEVLEFIKLYEESAPLLYKKLGLEY
jgi:hypothetical protein